MHKTQMQMIKDFNIKPITLNLTEEKVGSILARIGTGDHFLNITAEVPTLRATINKWDFMKLRNFCKAKDMVNKTKQQLIVWEKIFTKPTSDRGLITKTYNELKKINFKRTNNLTKMGHTSKQSSQERNLKCLKDT